MHRNVIEIFTDGSCHTQLGLGGWAAILFVEGHKTVLQGEVEHTNHNRMELLAVIKAIEFVDNAQLKSDLVVITDSQYVFRIPERMEKLKRTDFITKKGNPLHNQDLLQVLIDLIETHTIEFVKVKAHQHSDNTDLGSAVNGNAEVDKLARQMVRDAVSRM